MVRHNRPRSLGNSNRAGRLHVDRLSHRGSRSQRERGLADRGRDHGTASREHGAARRSSSPLPAPRSLSPPPPHYTVRTEPFIPTQADQLSALGVGRLPLESLGDTSVMFARGLLRKSCWPTRAAGVDGRELACFRKLVLCETISRVTASEFRTLASKSTSSMANGPTRRRFSTLPQRRILFSTKAISPPRS